ncbi:hypothetical protein ALC56_14589 [Trachymyrmex septentrionalis]|uniref:Uncharacterized protein n=1 Tax=Trachymyrmex septentrionalis TaxID=34720 RepID=A0A195ERD0_9HYME|nr:hypothetical protein ALC56_14589 [Trachymyrmex septentrionalis]
MPLCGAVTKLTRLSPNTDDCTLRTPAAAAPTVWGCLGGGIDSGRKESRKNPRSRERLAPIHADAVAVGERSIDSLRRLRKSMGRHRNRSLSDDISPVSDISIVRVKADGEKGYCISERYENIP